jgi:2-iminobutanoate/2-iminopropanoate deaminase
MPYFHSFDGEFVLQGLKKRFTLPENFTMKKIIVSKNAPAPIGPYSQAVMVNGMLYISGQIAINPATQEYVPAEIESEAMQVMENLQAILAEAGLSFSHVIKTNIFLSDMNDFAKVNAIYGGFFTADFPARETVQVSVLPKNCKVEISMIAAQSALDQ